MGNDAGAYLQLGHGKISYKLMSKDSTYYSHFLRFIAFTSGLETQYLKINITSSTTVVLLILPPPCNV